MGSNPAAPTILPHINSIMAQALLDSRLRRPKVRRAVCPPLLLAVCLCAVLSLFWNGVLENHHQSRCHLCSSGWIMLVGVRNWRSPDRNGICLADRPAPLGQYVAVSKRRHLCVDPPEPDPSGAPQGPLRSGLRSCPCCLICCRDLFAAEYLGCQHSSSVLHGAFHDGGSRPHLSG